MPTATLESGSSQVLAALVDLDDFVVATAAHGQVWARRQVASVGVGIERALGQAAPGASWRLEPPDEWMLIFRGADPALVQAQAADAADRVQAMLRSHTDVTATISLGLLSADAGDTDAAERTARETNARKLILGGDRIIEPTAAAGSAGPPIRIEGELRRLVRAADAAGATALLLRWLDRCAREPGSSPEQLRRWLFGELLYTVDVARSRRLSDGSTDWLAACAQLPLSELAAVHQIHERSYLRLWLERTLDAIIGEPARAHGEPLIDRAERYLAEHYHEPDLQLRGVAAAIAVSPFHIAHLFQRERGTTFLRHLTGLRMRAARRLLADRRLTVDHVARQVGYRSTKQFRVVFKREVGLAPTEYRNSARHS